jgi:hypothetical protein
MRPLRCVIHPERLVAKHVVGDGAVLRVRTFVSSDLRPAFRPLPNSVKYWKTVKRRPCNSRPRRKNGTMAQPANERKPLSSAQREARKAFLDLGAAKVMTDHEMAQKAFHDNRERLKSERMAREAGVPMAKKS